MRRACHPAGRAVICSCWSRNRRATAGPIGGSSHVHTGDGTCGGKMFQGPRPLGTELKDSARAQVLFAKHLAHRTRHRTARQNRWWPRRGIAWVEQLGVREIQFGERTGCTQGWDSVALLCAGSAWRLGSVWYLAEASSRELLSRVRQMAHRTKACPARRSSNLLA